MAEQKLNTRKTEERGVPKLTQVLVEKPLEFNNVISTSTITSAELEKHIADLFGAMFADFEGCKIMPLQTPGQPESLKCKLYFKPVMAKVDDTLYAVKVRGEEVKKQPYKGRGLDLSEVVNSINMLATSKQFELEDIAKEALAEFLVIADAKVVDRLNEDLGKVVKVRLPKNWNMYTEEIVDTINNTRFQNPYLVVTLDLLPIVAKLYGKKDYEEEAESRVKGYIPRDRYQYSVTVVKVINPTMRSYILEIRRIDIKELNKLAQSIGYGMVSGSIVMTRR